MKHFVQIIMAVLFSSILVSCKKYYPPRPVIAADQRSREEKEALLPHEMLEIEGIRFLINYPKGTADMTFRLFKESPNRREVRLGVIEESREYYVLSNHLDLNSEFILSVEYKRVSDNGAFQVSINGIGSLKGPTGLQLPDYLYAKESAGARRELLKIRKGNLKFAFYTL